ncbi:MAG: 4-hydroxy-3-methylbut-2-enyl diphosphate reductase 2 [Phycisphaerae bacterium]|nr:4-hydroxy-3-methylbut-2-enyl diphosphate reductase 2 [Phycisphaerae bacterium]
MQVFLANPRGFCAGVDRAIRIVDLALEVYGPPIYVRKQIVHNSHVVRGFEAKGVIFVEELAEVPGGALAILSAHGVSPQVHSEARARGLRVIDATCPLVTKVHLEVLRFVKQGYHIILIGHAGHDEVVGTTGHAPEHITLIENEQQAREKPVPPHRKLMVLTQTTLGIDDTAGVVRALRERFPELELPPTEDICYATQNRQDAVKAMSEQGIDLLLVVGSPNSSNAARLVEVGRARRVPGYLIDSAADIRDAWLTGVRRVGVTAGASTPEPIIQGVLERLAAASGATVDLVTTAEESTVFQLPPGLREAAAERGVHLNLPVWNR